MPEIAPASDVVTDIALPPYRPRGWLILTGREDGLAVLLPSSRVFYASDKADGGCDVGVDAHEPVMVAAAERVADIVAMLRFDEGGSDHA